MLKNNILMVCFFFLASLTFGQYADINKIDFEIGFLLETTDLINNRIYQNIDKQNSFSEFYPLSIYLSSRVCLTSSSSLEFRPGFILGGDYFSGIEYGLYFRYNIKDYNLLIITGINIHNNIGDSHGTGTFSEISDESVSLLGISLGYKVKDNIALILSFYEPLSSYRIYSISIYDGDTYNVNLKHIIKAGLDITF